MTQETTVSEIAIASIILLALNDIMLWITNNDLLFSNNMIASEIPFDVYYISTWVITTKLVPLLFVL